MLYWTDQKSAELFQDLYHSALAYSAEKYGSFESFFHPAGRQHSMTDPDTMLQAVEALREPFAKPDGCRGMYLQDMLQAVETFVRLLKGEEIPYQEAVRRILGIEMRPISSARAERVRREIDALLWEDGYEQATTAQKVSCWYADNLIQPEMLADTARKYLAILQKLTRQILDLPQEEGWGNLEIVQGVSWGAFSQYEGNYITNMLMNRDSVWKKPTFIDTVAHELYPGHHTWYCMRESAFRKGESPLEAATLGICSAENLIFEGLPESGAHFIGIDDPGPDKAMGNTDHSPEVLKGKEQTAAEADRTAAEADQFAADAAQGLSRKLRRKIMVARKILEYVRILEINSCYRCQVEHWPKEELIAAATKDGWIEPAVAERVYRYYGHPVNGLYYPSYYYGRWIVTYAFDRFPKERRAEFFRMAYGEPHSTGSFIRRVKEMTGEAFDPVSMAQNV